MMNRSIDIGWETQEDIVLDRTAPPLKAIYLDKVFNIQFTKIQQIGKYIGTGDIYIKFIVDVAHYFFKNGQLADYEDTPSFRFFFEEKCFFAHWQDDKNPYKAISFFTNKHFNQKNPQFLIENVGEFVKHGFNIQEAIVYHWDNQINYVVDSDELHGYYDLMMSYNLKKSLNWEQK